MNDLWRRTVRMIALAAACAGMTACADLDIGPPPADAISPAARAPASAHDASPGAIPADEMPAAPERNSTAPLAVSVEDAVLTGLRYNPELQVERFNVPINRTLQEQQRAVFDPNFSGNIQGGQTNSPNGGVNAPRVNTENASGNLGLSQYLPTGTTITGGVAATYEAQSLYSDKNWSAGPNISVTQSLLRGADLNANLALLREAGLAVRVSQYGLRAYAESLVSQIEMAYWDYALAERQIEIYQNAVDVAQAQLDQTNEFIKHGALADSERAAALSELELRKEDLINARGTLETSRLAFLQLISPGSHSRFWGRVVELKDKPFVPAGATDDVELHAALARRQRPDINEARLQIQSNQLEVVRTKNGLLPQLDFSITFSKTGYAQSLGSAITDVAHANDYSVVGSLTFAQPIGNRAARAQYEQAQLTRDQSIQALNNLTNQVEVDVRSAYVSVETAREEIAATAATRAAAEEALRAEQGKFKVGKSTNLLVATAQRDLLQAQINEISAVVATLKNLVSLYQTEGSLLDRRYIDAPGRVGTVLPEEIQAMRDAQTVATTTPSPATRPTTEAQTAPAP
jgi:outer membrane protein